MSDTSTDPPPQDSLSKTSGFAAVHLLYAVALIASYAATWGIPGGICSLVVLAVWAFIFYSISRPRALATAIGLAILGMCLIGLLMPVTTAHRGEAVWRSTCKNNLKNIMLALHNYHDEYGSFPPAFVTDKNGKPMHSWRVLLLPFIDESPLYKQYDFDKPWDSPENLKLLDHKLNLYACPSHDSYDEKPNTTSYVAVVGPNTAWPGSTGTRLSDFKDGAANSIMLVESNSEKIPWTAPRDLTLKEAVQVLSSTETEAFDGHRSEDFFHKYYYGRHVTIADGMVRFAPFGTDPQLARELLILNDGKPDAPWELNGSGTMSQEQLKWGNVIRFAIAVVLTVFPLPGVWLNPRGGVAKPEFARPPHSG